jgi:hypothetical protein
MLESKSKGRAAIGMARAVVSDREVRHAASQAASPVTQLTIALGRRAARRRARRRVEQLEEAILTVRAVIATFGPQAIEQLHQAGIVERPRPIRRGPRFLVGALAGAGAGAGAMYLLEPHQRRREHRLQQLLSH